MTGLLYASREKAAGFMRNLSREMQGQGYDTRHCMTKISRSDFYLLDKVGGVVFIGPQTSSTNPGEAVFISHPAYWGFLDEAHERNLLVAAVLNDPVTLPGDNRGIDFVLKSNRDMPISSIVEELAEFFNKRIL
jgi:hypothetical protein